MAYQFENHQIFNVNDEGERTLLCNFEAWINVETHILDGLTDETLFTIHGIHRTGREFTDLTMPATEFNAMQWPSARWGAAAIMTPGQGTRDHIRCAIQLKNDPEVRTIYKHIGWSNEPTPRFLHGKGAIGPKGNDTTVTVQLPPDLQRYALPDPPDDPGEALRSVLSLIELTKPTITWPLLLATLTPILGEVDFAMHLSGKTGTFKSELASLFQSFYGPAMDARHLPGSWSSTANALEALSFLAKNAIFCIDDFVPSGTSWQIRAYQQTADKIIRAQGNQAGRARLTDTSRLQQTMYPRGLILSSGEDVPDGHSIRARMFIIEITPGDITPSKLTAAQAERPRYSEALSAYIQRQSKRQTQIADLADQYRKDHLTIGHARTPSMTGRLLATADDFIAFLVETETIKGPKANQLRQQAHEAVTETAGEQSEYLMTADPCEIFCNAIRTMLAANTAHIRTVIGGIPNRAETLGWTAEQGLGDLPHYKSHGPCIGWINWTTNELFIEATAGTMLVRKAGGNNLSVTNQTLFKRLRDSNLLTRTDPTRSRNTIRIQAEKHPRQVIALRADAVFQDDEGKPPTPEQQYEIDSQPNDQDDDEPPDLLSQEEPPEPPPDLPAPPTPPPARAIPPPMILTPHPTDPRIALTPSGDQVYIPTSNQKPTKTVKTKPAKPAKPKRK